METELPTHFFHKPKSAFQNSLKYIYLEEETKEKELLYLDCKECVGHLAHD